MDGTQFTVFFEDPFWVGILVAERSGRRLVNRAVFGAEPTNAQLIVFMRDVFPDVLAGAWEASDSHDCVRPAAGRVKSAKRGQREAAGEQRRGPGKALAAYHEAFEKKKAEFRESGATDRSAEASARFERRRLKKKAARRGK